MAFEPDRQPAYKYLPLPEGQAFIRILHLLPELDSTSQIRCVSEIHPVDKAPPYTALSYTWGDKEPRQQIILDGQPYMIRPNLHNFLKRIRHETSARILWTDAICIDQENNIEKGHQVAMMGDIYQSARNVFVWLGEAEDNSDQVMDFLIGIEESGRLVNEQRNHIVREVYDQRIVTPFLKLCTRPYWWRVWILQEVLLAKDIRILCGSRDVDLNILAALCSAWPLNMEDGTTKEYADYDYNFRPSETWKTVKCMKVFGGAAEGMIDQGPTPLERPFELYNYTTNFFMTFSRLPGHDGWRPEAAVDPDFLMSDTETFESRGHVTFTPREALEFESSDFDPWVATQAIGLMWVALRQTPAGMLFDKRLSRRQRKTPSEASEDKLEYLLLRYKEWRCADSRDRVFGLLSVAADYQAQLASGDQTRILYPDYTCNISKIFFEVTEFCASEFPVEFGKKLVSVLGSGTEDTGAGVMELLNYTLDRLPAPNTPAPMPSVTLKLVDYGTPDQYLEMPREIMGVIPLWSPLVFTRPLHALEESTVLSTFDIVDAHFDPSRRFSNDKFMSPWRIVLIQSAIEPTDVVFQLDDFAIIGRPSLHNAEELHCIGVGVTPSYYQLEHITTKRICIDLFDIYWWFCKDGTTILKSQEDKHSTTIPQILYWLLLTSCGSGGWSYENDTSDFGRRLECVSPQSKVLLSPELERVEGSSTGESEWETEYDPESGRRRRVRRMG